MQFLSDPDIQLATSHTSLYLPPVKGKDKKRGQLIGFKSSHPV